MLESIAVNTLLRKFWQWEGPTWLVAAAIYASWFLMVWFHASIPWWLMIPLGGYILAWHFSLQHEAIHGWLGIPAWLRFAIVWPPIGAWFPFELYKRSHTTHHRNTYLTYPGEDTETYYQKSADWERFSPFWRAVLMAHQTLAGRLLLGPLLRVRKQVIVEYRKLAAGNYADVPIWIRHFIAVGIMFWFITQVAGMRWYEYVVLVAYPGLSLSLLRAFIEHKAGERPGHRVAIVESNAFWSVLFLYNNMHSVHHVFPTMPWYRIPGYYRVHKQEVLRHNDGFWFRGYTQIAARWMFTPVFHPAHPKR